MQHREMNSLDALRTMLQLPVLHRSPRSEAVQNPSVDRDKPRLVRKRREQVVFYHLRSSGLTGPQFLIKASPLALLAEKPWVQKELLPFTAVLPRPPIS